MSDRLDIDKTSTALTVIDLQAGIVARPAYPHDARTVVENAMKLAEAFRKNGMPVFLVRVTPSPDLKYRLVPIADNPGHPAPPDPEWGRIAPELGPKEGDFIITKRQWGAFYGTELDLELRRRKISTIILCGISTNIGVESTARVAYEYGYQQIFAEDAMSAGQSKEVHENTVKNIFARIGRVRKTEEILTALNS